MSALSKQPLWCRKLYSVLPIFVPRKDSLWSSLGFVSNLKLLALLPLCPLKHKRGGKQERRSEEAALKEMKVVCFFENTFFVGGWQLISGGWPLLGPQILWNLILGPSWFGQSSVVFFSENIALLEEAFVWTQSCFHRQSQKTIYVKTLWKTWKHHPHLQRAQSELLGDFQDRRCYLLTGGWAWNLFS